MLRDPDAIEGGKPAPVRRGQLDEVGVGHLAVADDARRRLPPAKRLLRSMPTMPFMFDTDGSFRPRSICGV